MNSSALHIIATRCSNQWSSIVNRMINRESVVPPWQQLADLLRARIERGELAAGDRLPSIVALSQEHDLAPVTVRKAIVQLQREGIIESRVGWGTFVVEKRPNPDK